MPNNTDQPLDALLAWRSFVPEATVEWFGAIHPMFPLCSEDEIQAIILDLLTQDVHPSHPLFHLILHVAYHRYDPEMMLEIGWYRSPDDVAERRFITNHTFPIITFSNEAEYDLVGAEEDVEYL